MTTVQLTVNGEAHRLDIDVRRSLLDLLRETLGSAVECLNRRREVQREPRNSNICGGGLGFATLTDFWPLLVIAAVG